MQIDRGIFYLSPVKDAAEIVIQVFTDDEGMSRQLVKTAFYPPIKDEAGTGIFHFVNLFRRESPRDLTFFYKFFHRIGKIRITNDIIRFYKITFCHNPFRSSVFRFNLLHRRIVPNASSQLLKKFCHLLSHRMHTAFDKPSPIKQFYHRNDIVQRGAFLRGHPDIKRLKTEHLLNIPVRNEGCHHFLRRIKRLKFQCLNHHERIIHIPPIPEGASDKIFQCNLISFIHRTEIFQKTFRTLGTPRFTKPHQIRQIRVDPVTAHRRTLEVHFIHRIQPNHRNIIIRIPTCQFKNLTIDRRHHHQSRTYIKSEAFFFDLMHFASGHRALLINFDPVSGMLKPNRCGKTGNAGADYNHFPAHKHLLPALFVLLSILNLKTAGIKGLRLNPYPLKSVIGR